MVTRIITALLVLWHPIHSSSATLAVDSGSRTVSIVLRAFADDFPPGVEPEAVGRYLAERLRITDRAGGRVPLRVTGVQTDGIVISTTLVASAPRGLSGYRIWHGVLTERFSDQVNIVQARYGGRSASLLFTASDSAKQLP